VSKATLDAAIQLADYLIAHARAAYGEMEADPVIGGAQYLLDWIKRENRDSFTKREAHRGTQSRFKKVNDLEPVLKLLIDHEYIRLQPQEKRPGPGQKPSPIFFVNPIKDRNDRNDRIPSSGEETANSVHSVHSVTIDPENFSPPEEGDVEEAQPASLGAHVVAREGEHLAPPEAGDDEGSQPIEGTGPETVFTCAQCGGPAEVIGGVAWCESCDGGSEEVLVWRE
jgi:hypothetical protein